MGEPKSDLFAVMRPDMLAFEDFWKRCLHGSPITCSATGKEYPGVAKPSLFFIDPMQYDLLSHVRATDTSPHTSVLSWMMAFVGMMVSITFPRKYGGSAEIILPEFTPEEVENGRLMKPHGEIKRIRGLPDMYDWEAYPQELVNIPIMKDQDKIQYTFHQYTKYVILIL
jgi:hypothetical protein